eukprot:SAG22_NODE_774_length_7293_cov_15.888796_4_plen_456_part_00
MASGEPTTTATAGGFAVDSWGQAKKEGYDSILDKQLEEAAAAASRIQAARRGQLDRRDMAEQSKAASKIQAEYRGRNARLEHPRKPPVPRQAAPRLLIPQTVREIGEAEEQTAWKEVERGLADGEFEAGAVGRISMSTGGELAVGLSGSSVTVRPGLKVKAEALPIYRVEKKTRCRAEPSMRSDKLGSVEVGEEVEVVEGPIELEGLGIERVRLAGDRGWCSLQNKEMEAILKRVYEAPKVNQDVLVTSVSPFSAARPKGIGEDREVVSPLLDVRSLPGTWNASFLNGVMIKLRHCCGSTRGLQVHWRPWPNNPYAGNPWEDVGGLSRSAAHVLFAAPKPGTFLVTSPKGRTLDCVWVQHKTPHPTFEDRRLEAGPGAASLEVQLALVPFPTGTPKAAGRHGRPDPTEWSGPYRLPRGASAVFRLSSAVYRPSRIRECKMDSPLAVPVPCLELVT